MNKEEIKVGSLVRRVPPNRSFGSFGVGIVTGTVVFRQAVFWTVFWTGLSKTHQGYLDTELELIP